MRQSTLAHFLLLIALCSCSYERRTTRAALSASGDTDVSPAPAPVPGSSPVALPELVPAGSWENITPPVPQPWANTSSFYYGWGWIDGAKADAPGTIYVAVDHGGDSYSGVWKSIDSGNTWAMTSQGPSRDFTAGAPQPLVVDPTDSEVVYAGTIKGGSTGLMKTVDGGRSWTKLLPSNYEHDIYHASIDPSDHNHLLLTFHSCQADWPLVSGGVSGANCGLLETRDGGASWTPRPAAWRGASQFVFFLGKKDDGSPDNRGECWIVSNQNGGGIWRTMDAGASWSQVGSFDQTHGMQSLYRAQSGALYMGSVGKIFRSTDNGRSWTDTGAPSGSDGYGGIVGDGTQIWAMLSNTGFAVGGPYAWQTLSETDVSSAPGDSHWRSFGTTTYADGPNHMLFDRVNGYVFAASWGGGVWRLKLQSAPPAPAASGPMPIISQNVPAFTSGNANVFTTGALANDTSPSSAWVSDRLPAWIAYDLSSAPLSQRQNVLITWASLHVPDYVVTPAAYMQMPIDYVIEVNSAPGGAAPPASGWVQVASVTGNNRSARTHLANLDGGNWVRMTVTSGSDPANVSLDLAVYSANQGATDAWLFMGDSITNISMGYPFDDAPALVHQNDSTRWPFLVNAAIGGTSTTTAASILGDRMSQFAGKYVVLAYGTNDDANNFQMETLVSQVLAAGKIPVVPRMPWSDQKLVSGPIINGKIDALYAKYPQLVRGPDLWAAFLNRTDLIPPGDVHPNSAGQEYLRRLWADTISSIRQ